MLLEGKRLLVTGVLTRGSIAYSVAERATQEGAEIVLTGFGRTRRMTERAAKRLPSEPDVLELDVNSPDDFDALVGELRSRWGRLDGALHAIAFAPSDALGGRFLAAPPESAEIAFRTSAYSFKAMAEKLRPLFDEAGGGSLVGLDFDASVAWPVYDWMGVAKAALESVSRYLARDLGPAGVRVNLVSAGPVETPAAEGIPGFDKLAGLWREQAPLGWNTSDPVPVADAVLFLLSDWARGISGEILHVDGGFHAMGAPVGGDAQGAEAQAGDAQPAEAQAKTDG
jgi:meromycolic acid enoyl-[acyl-carrier-protein] reductase